MKPKYSTINLNTMPGQMKLPGQTLKQQAVNAGYQDIFRDIQLQRQAAFRKESVDGQFTSEFSGFGGDPVQDLTTYLDGGWLNYLVLTMLIYLGYEMGRYSYKHKFLSGFIS